MLPLVLVLVATNAASVAVLAWYVMRPDPQPAPEREIAHPLDAALRPGPSSTAVRRVITVEILNPLELAGRTGRFAGIAGSVAPGLTRRIVYDRALRMLRQQLAEEDVVADVRLHVIDPVGRQPAPE